MRNSIYCASLVLAVAAGAATARPLPSPDVIAQMNKEASNDAHQAIARVYGPIHAKTDFFAKHVANGITFWDVAIKNADGEATAVVTNAGDFLVQGFPMSAGQVPAPVQTIVQNLFKTPATNASIVKTFQYHVYLKTGAAAYGVRMDAAGRLFDIKRQGQARFDNASHMPEAAPAEKQLITQIVAKNWPGAQVSDVRVADPAAGFYFANFTEGGRGGWTEISGKDFVEAVAEPIDAAKLPAPATRTINDFFKSDQLAATHELREQLIHVEQTANGETIELRIRPDGSVEGIETLSATSPVH